MTQQLRLCLLKNLLFFLLFEPIVCPPSEPFNLRQDRSSYYDTTQYYTANFGEAPAASRRNFEYQQYQPQLQLQPQPRYGSAQYQRRQAYDDSQSQESQVFATHVQQRDLQPLQPSFPYQNINKPFVENAQLEAKIRSIFHVGPEQGTHLFNATLETNSNTSVPMHSDDSLLNSTSSLSFLTTSTTLMPTSLSAMNNSEPTFQVLRTPDGKLSLAFNDSSLQRRPTNDQTTNAQKRPGIIYPDQSVVDSTFNGCEDFEGQSLCKKVRNYPKLLHLDTILKQEFTQLGLFFAEDLELPLNVKQRFGGGDYDEIDPCDSVERIIYPQAGMTKDLQWMFIVNDNTTYRQGVRIEECSGKDRPCNVIHQSLPNHYTSVCRQHYNYRQLVAITDKGKVVKDHFKIPSCCKCMLRNVSPF